VQKVHAWAAAGLIGALCGCASSEPRPYTAESVIKAQETAPLRNVAPEATVSAIYTPVVMAPAIATPQNYPISNLEHWITKVIDRGKVVELEDGSVWEINPAYQAKTMVWLVAQKITVSNGLNPQYPFQLSKYINERHDRGTSRKTW
jgi:hypothetical protein